MPRVYLTLALFVALSPLPGTSAGAREHLAISVPSGLYDQEVRVEMRSVPEDATIYLTTHFEVPNPATAVRYEKALRLTNTTIVRAQAWRGGKPIGPCETRSYIFPAEVIHQSGSGFPKTWGETNGVPVLADYQMDPEIVTNAFHRKELVPALKALPAVSLVLPGADLFGAERGIYSHPLETGPNWERAASFEFLSANGPSTGALKCGLRIQGGWNRRPEGSPKHAFRVVFRKKYGAGKLHANLFGAGAASQFDTLVLRAGCNNTWLHWNGAERKRGDYIRDQWMRDSLRNMDRPSAAGIFVHLYLNGLYWGIYNLAERPDASFAARHFGGEPSDYDSRNADKILSGDAAAWKELMRRVNAGVSTTEQLKHVSELLDLAPFIDFMLVNLYGANADWDRSSNWYAARKRTADGKFIFFVWDGERTLESMDDDTFDADDDESPTRIFHRLCASEEFRHALADRARTVLTQGALAPENAAARYKKWADVLQLPILAESARWGDYRRDFHRYKEGPYELYTRDDHWQPEVNRLLTEYFPNRTTVFIKQLTKRGLYQKSGP